MSYYPASYSASSRTQLRSSPGHASRSGSPKSPISPSAGSASPTRTRLPRPASSLAAADYHATKRQAAELERARKEWNKANDYRPDPAEHAARHKEIARLRMLEADLRFKAGHEHHGGFNSGNKCSVDHWQRIEDAKLSAAKHARAAQEIESKYLSGGSLGSQPAAEFSDSPDEISPSTPIYRGHNPAGPNPRGGESYAFEPYAASGLPAPDAGEDSTRSAFFPGAADPRHHRRSSISTTMPSSQVSAVYRSGVSQRSRSDPEPAAHPYHPNGLLGMPANAPIAHGPPPGWPGQRPDNYDTTARSRQPYGQAVVRPGSTPPVSMAYEQRMRRHHIPGASSNYEQDTLALVDATARMNLSSHARPQYRRA